MGRFQTIAVLGGGGMVGSDLVKNLSHNYQVTPITKKDYPLHKGKEFDVLINANGNSRRHWANLHPLEDLNLSVVSAYQSLFDFKFKKYIYISSINVYENPSDPQENKENKVINFKKLQPYGFHRYINELIISRNVLDHLILRCSIILGNNIKRGTFFDILKSKPLFVSIDSRWQLISTKALAEIIHLFIKKEIKNEIFNISGRETFALKDAKEYFEKPIVISPKAEKQIYEMNISKLETLYTPLQSTEYLKEFVNSIKN